jgi:hypothetical protein
MAIAIAVLVSFAAFSSVPAEARQHGHGGGGYHGGGYHGGGHVHVGVGFGYYGYWGGYYPWFYWGPYSPFWYPYPYFYPPYPYGYGGYPYYPTSSVRLEVIPKEAKVFVDGYFAGVVDDYDGTFQRLHVSPGKHEILLYLEGYHSLKQTLYLSPDSTYKMKGAMTKLAPSDPPEPPPPSPPPPPQGGNGQPGPPDQNEGPFGPPQQGTDVRPGPPPPQYPEAQAPPMPPNTRFGKLVVRVQPADAEIYVDGERWQTPDSAERLEVNLVAGRHHVEIHKSGFDSFSTEVDVRPGQTTPVNVSLPQSH